MDSVSFQIDEKIRDQIITFYQDYQIKNDGEYILFCAKYEKIVITIFQSKKGYKALFAGPNCLQEAKIFNNEAKLNIPKEKNVTQFIDISSQIGSDEVGFGDFFGPLVVVACIYEPSLKVILDKIDDSKKLTDEFILNFVPQIIDKVTFSKLTVHNEKYNSLIAQNYNMNKIKAILHNQALYNLSKKRPDITAFYIDQFCNEESYFKYVKNEKHIVSHITFMTKGESHFPSVALASMIARYSFLKEMEALNKKYQMEFVFGASKKTDEFAKKFIEKYSLTELDKVCKKNFVNYTYLLDKKND